MVLKYLNLIVAGLCFLASLTGNTAYPRQVILHVSGARTTRLPQSDTTTQSSRARRGVKDQCWSCNTRSYVYWSGYFSCLPAVSLETLDLYRETMIAYAFVPAVPITTCRKAAEIHRNARCSNLRTLTSSRSCWLPAEAGGHAMCGGCSNEHYGEFLLHSCML